jgi:membrane protease YdiL (CAAX protease family)
MEKPGMKTNRLSTPDSDTSKNDLKSLATRFPMFFAFTVTLVAMVCLVWPLWIPGFSQTALLLWGRVTICALAIFLLTFLGWWRETGFVRPTSWRILVPYLPLICLIIVTKTFDVITAGIHVFNIRLILLGLFVYLVGGFEEEAIFRGLVLRTLLPMGIMRAALLSALFFALAHFLNLLAGANLSATLLQVGFAFLAGLVYTAPLAVTRNIWPLVVIHGLGNFISFLTAGGFLNTAATSKGPSLLDIVLSLSPYLLVAAYSFWSLNRYERRLIASPSSQSQVLDRPSRDGQKNRSV